MIMSETSETPAPADDIHPEAVGLFGICALLTALVLLAVMPFATQVQPVGKAWFLSPRNLPMAGLGLMVIGGGLALLQFLRSWGTATNSAALWRRARSGYADTWVSLQYSLLFGLYVWALSYVGFALSTLIFGQVCLWCAGLTGWKWTRWNAVFAIAIVILLRGVMGLWFPQAPILSFTPAWFANSIGPYL
jgi:hypothetical protein